MKLIPLAALSLATLAATVGCGSDSSDAPVKAAAAPTTEAVPTTLTTVTTVMVVATTPTTVCVDTSAARLAAAESRLRTNQGLRDQFVAAGRDMEGAIAQIQLVIDNTGRQVEHYQREVVTAQGEYDRAAAEFGILGLDSSRDKMNAEADDLADVKGLLASWEALRTKAFGDLARYKATAATYPQRLAEFTRQIAIDQQQVNAAGVPDC